MSYIYIGRRRSSPPFFVYFYIPSVLLPPALLFHKVSLCTSFASALHIPYLTNHPRLYHRLFPVLSLRKCFRNISTEKIRLYTTARPLHLSSSRVSHHGERQSRTGPRLYHRFLNLHLGLCNAYDMVQFFIMGTSGIECRSPRRIAPCQNQG